MSYGAQQVVRHYVDNGQMAANLIGQWEALAARAKTGLAQVQAENLKAREALAVAYLLEMSPEGLANAQKLTGYRGFSRRDPLKAMVHEKLILQKTIARIVVDERWLRRRYLVGPQGELTAAHAEAKSMLEPWVVECAKFEELPGFLNLYSAGYDTPNWKGHWFEASYWKEWAAGDHICKVLELDDFGDDVLPAYERCRVPRDQWVAEVEKANTKVDEVHDLVRTRDAAEQRIPLLPELYLTQCQHQLAEFFANADFGLLEEWLEASGGDRGVQQGLRRCAGLKAKLDFLQELNNQGIKDQITGLKQRAAKFHRKSVKYQRSKYQGSRFSDRDLDLKFGQKYAKYQTQPDKLGRQVQRILDYDDYGRFDLNNDPELWWVEFTKKGPSRFTPRLRNWYDRNPNSAPVYDQDDVGEAVAQAAATFDRHDSGYLS